MKFEIMLNMYFNRIHNFVRKEVDAENHEAALSLAHDLCMRWSGVRQRYNIATIKTVARVNFERAQRNATPARPTRRVPRSARDKIEGGSITFRFPRSWSRPKPLTHTMRLESWWALIERCKMNSDQARCVVSRVANGEIPNDLPA